MSGVELVFTGFALLTWGAAVLAVTSRQVVHAALWLVLALGGLAGVYLALGAQVVALVQILVYVGAIVVLVLFALMLTQAPIGVHRDLDAPLGRRLAALGVGLSVALLIGGTLAVAVGDRQVRPDLAAGAPTPLGTAIFAHWLLPFELLSLLLLAALVAALAVSRGRASDGTDGTDGSEVR
ncbi:MAG: NADH-quinone oxidoreductase subunit J [Kineosporiaceae bacterium]